MNKHFIEGQAQKVKNLFIRESEKIYINTDRGKNVKKNFTKEEVKW